MAAADLRARRATLLKNRLPRSVVYWTDLSASTLVGYAAFSGAAFGPAIIAVPSFVVATVALLRAAYFVHEIVHVGRAIRGFEFVWNLFVGLPLLLPSFMADSHRAHHKPATFGTAGDPEYEPVARWGRIEFLLSVLSALVIPPLLVLRFGIMGPLSIAVPPMRRFVMARLSSLVTNASFVGESGGGYTPRVLILELAASSFVWAVGVLTGRGVLDLRVALIWWAMIAAALGLNQLRTNIAHGYTNEGPRMSFDRQVADSTTVVGGAVWWELFFPVGTRYHAMHHLAPSLPYHALPDAHRELMESAPGAPYLEGLKPSPRQGTCIARRVTRSPACERSQDRRH